MRKTIFTLTAAILIFLMCFEPGTLPAARWILILLLLAMTSRSLFCFETLSFPDGAFSLHVCLGMACIFTPVWFLCASTGLSFGTPLMISIWLIVLMIILSVKAGKGFFLRRENSGSEREKFLFGAAVFILIFAIAFYLKGFKPFIDCQTEQYMDYGFINTMYRQQRVPFEDIWAIGKKVNYYYLGQAVVVFLCRLSFVTPEFGYNFILCTLFALTALSVFELVCAFLEGIPGMKTIPALTGGIMAALMCSCGGNGHWIVFGILRQIYDKLNISAAPGHYWFSDSTLYIGKFPDPDKGKHEFPAYTFILGDVHAHVCNMLFTIPLLAIVIDYALSERESIYDEKGSPDIYRMLRGTLNSHVMLMGLLMGLSIGVNFWDFPIYYVVAGSVILFCDLSRQGVKGGTVLYVLLKGLIILAISFFIAIPFRSNFIMPLSGVRLCSDHSPFYKLFLIWFPYVIPAICLLAVCLRGEKDRHGLIMTAMVLCALGLILLPEIVYVDDIYGNEYSRYNTMFKLTFQAFIILAICYGLLIGILLNRWREEKLLKIPTAAFCVISLMLSLYMVRSVKSWFGNILLLNYRSGISACEFIKKDPAFDDLRDAISIINADRRKNIHIIEEGGMSYSNDNRLSVFTGACTVSGWYVHEWVWHNDNSNVGKRHDMVKAFYESGDSVYCSKLAKTFDLDYIYVGENVTEDYLVDYKGFIDLGECIWQSTDGRHMLIKISEKTETDKRQEDL